MPVYHAKNRKKPTRAKPLLALLAVLVVGGLLLAAFWADRRAVEAMAEESQTEESISGEGPAAALEAIYETSDIRGVSTVNAVILDEQFGVTTDLYLKAWGRYTDGTYGVADVFIFRTLQGQEDALREALEQVKTNRIVECRNYDIYNSLECAESAQIFQVGEEYMCLVMIEDADGARDIIEDCLTKNK
jgi:hypothetical protein